jgi:predicted PurR-regulated permease PerM
MEPDARSIAGNVQVADEHYEFTRPIMLSTAFVDSLIQITCLLLLFYWAAILLMPFVLIIAWSIIIVVALYPVFRWIVGHLHLHPRLAAFAVTAICLVVLLGPATWLSVSLVQSLRNLAEKFGSGEVAIPPPSETVRGWPLVGNGVYEFWSLASNNLQAALAQIGPQLKPISGALLGIASNAGLNMVIFLAAIIIAGFLFSAGPSLAETTKSIIRRVARRRGDEFVDLAGATIRNLARGVIGISLLQALLAGIGFIIGRVPAAGLFSLLILILGIMQIGATIVIIPIVVWSWITMDTAAALMFTAYMIPVSVVDNFLRPFVMAHGLKTPLLVIFIGLIGGVLAHGLIGLFLGPIVLAIAWELLVAWRVEGAGAALAHQIQDRV